MQSINFEDFERNTSPYSDYVERLAKAFCTSKRIVAITGAGISVSAGIPVLLFFQFIPANLLTYF